MVDNILVFSVLVLELHQSTLSTLVYSVLR